MSAADQRGRPPRDVELAVRRRLYGPARNGVLSVEPLPGATRAGPERTLRDTWPNDEGENHGPASSSDDNTDLAD
jgi:hypothetical protein